MSSKSDMFRGRSFTHRGLAWLTGDSHALTPRLNWETLLTISRFKIFCVRKVWSNFQYAQRTGVWRYHFVNPVVIVLFKIFYCKNASQVFVSQNFGIKFLAPFPSKKTDSRKMLWTVRKVADAENGSVFLNMEFNGSAKSTEKVPLVVNKSQRWRRAHRTAQSTEYKPRLNGAVVPTLNLLITCYSVVRAFR